MLRIISCLAIGLLCGACKSQSAVSRSDMPENQQVMTSDFCAADKFAEFSRLFAEDADFQRKHTDVFIEKQAIDVAAEPEPKTIRYRLSRDKLKFPVLPLKGERDGKALQMLIESVESDGARVKLYKPETDYQIHYFFKRNTCWTLIRIQDDSL